MTSDLPGREHGHDFVGDAAEVAVPWSQVSFGPAADWVEPASIDYAVPAKDGAHKTYLDWSRQADADKGTSFHSTSVRLETQLSVQNESQWQLNLDPRFQSLKLHWLRVVRGNQSVDHMRRDKMRLIQRETQLEQHVINGSWTLLVVLGDVRPGDVIESGYTYTSWHPISKGTLETFFAVPSQFVVGRYMLSVLFSSSRPTINYKSSPDAPARSERVMEDGRTKWIWLGSQRVLREPEANVPSSHLDYVWIQASDVASWNQLASRAAHAWAKADEMPNLDIYPEFEKPPEVTGKAVTDLVRHIQDQFRYLSIDLATGGWIPAAPDAVARQRHGDCKDLVWLATCALRRWGVNARPILVGTGLRGSIANLLPMTVIFNHAVLEVEVAGTIRWFDLTLRLQGGDFTTQPVGSFLYGLPVDPAANALQAQQSNSNVSLYVLHETINVDTRSKEPSIAEQRIWVEGFQAENMRRNRANLGAEAFSNDRLKQAQKRYGKAERLGTLQWRDDRERNTCELIEAFQLSEIVNPADRGERATYDVPANLVVQSLWIPEDKVRRAPWSMPFPMELRHTITVISRSMGSLDDKRRRWSTGHYTATLNERRVSGEWSKAARFISHSSEIPAEDVLEYRRLLVDFFRATSWRLFLPRAKSRKMEEATFNRLPNKGSGAHSYVPQDDPAGYPEAIVGELPPLPTRWQRTRARLTRFQPRRGWTIYIILFWFILVIARGCSVAVGNAP
jgi:hypothetical protein